MFYALTWNSRFQSVFMSVDAILFGSRLEHWTRLHLWPLWCIFAVVFVVVSNQIQNLRAFVLGANLAEYLPYERLYEHQYLEQNNHEQLTDEMACETRAWNLLAYLLRDEQNMKAYTNSVNRI